VDCKCALSSEGPAGVGVDGLGAFEPFSNPTGGDGRKIVEVVGDGGPKSSLEALGGLVCMRGWDGGRL